MSNTAFIESKQNDLTTNDYLQIMVIDNGDGTRSLRFIDQQTPNLPGAAAQIVASGDTLRAAGLTALAIGTAVSGGSANAVLFEDAGQLLAVDTGNFEYNNISFTLTVSSINLLVGITFPDNVRQTFNPGATVAGLNVGSVAADPTTPINGDLWYDSALNLLRARIGGASISLVGAAGADTQIIFNDAGAFGGDANLTWTKATDILTIGGSGQLRLPIGSGATPSIRFGGTESGFFIDGNSEIAVARAGSYNGVTFGGSNIKFGSGNDTGITREAAATLRVSDASTGIGFLRAGRTVSPRSTTPINLTAIESRNAQTNEGAGALIVMNLPPAAAGLEFPFIVQDADGIQVTAQAGDTIRLAAAVSSAGGTATSTTIGDVLILLAINNTEWIAIGIEGAGWVTA